MRSRILAEDDQILVCAKPAGLAVQSARPGEADMVSELKNYLAAERKRTAKSGTSSGPFSCGRNIPYLGVVHRLDQPVSGILVFAKTPEAAADLSRQASGAGETAVRSEKGSGAGKEKRMEKEYRALVYLERPLVCGPQGEMELTDFLKKEPGQNLSRVVRADTPGAKCARLKLRVLEQPYEAQERCACVAVRLYTGRHHQIRVQLAHAGMPLLGDLRYGSEESRACSVRMGIRSVCLCAYRLCFYHPVTGERMEFEEAEYPWRQFRPEKI